MIPFLIAGVAAIAAALISGILFGIRLHRLSNQMRDLSAADESRRCSIADGALMSRAMACHDLTTEQRQKLAVWVLGRDRWRLTMEACILSVLVAVVAGLGAWSVLSGWEKLDVTHVAVSAGGGEPQWVSIPASGLTLIQAVTHAKTLRSSNESEKENEKNLLVAVRTRDQRQQTHIYYIPLGLILSGLPGEMPLVPGDIVRVVRLDETSLGMLESTDPGVPFEVAGRVDKPGKYKTIEVSEPIMNVSTAEYAGSSVIDETPAEVILLTRQSGSGGPAEHFVIPVIGPQLDRALLECRIYANDHFEFSRLDEMPLFRAR